MRTFSIEDSQKELFKQEKITILEEDMEDNAPDLLKILNSYPPSFVLITFNNLTLDCTNNEA